MVVPYFKPLEVQAPKKTIAEQIDKPLPVAKADDGSKKVKTFIPKDGRVYKASPIKLTDSREARSSTR